MAILSRSPTGFLLVANDETSDNLAGENDAAAVLEAGAGADRAIAVVLEYVARDPLLTLVVTSDSDCGGIAARGIGPGAESLQGTVDSTAIYWVIHRGLFGD